MAQGKTPIETLQFVRALNGKLQLQTPSWKLIAELEQVRDETQRKEKINKIIEKLKDDKEKHILDELGPVGDLPLHQAFILKQYDLGKMLVDEFYSTENVHGVTKKGKFHPFIDKGINTPFMSDVAAWKPHVDIDDDLGQYTGETVLHIAIVHGNLDLIDWMLGKKIYITSRARGSFIKPISHPIIATVEDHAALAAEQDAHGAQSASDDMTCDFGEYPLSFAASVGSVDILKKLAKHAEHDGVEQEEFIEVLKVQRGLRTELGMPCDIIVAQADGGILRVLIELLDTQGNTALHMAVKHNQTACVDWLMSHHGKGSLRMHNKEVRTNLYTMMGVVFFFL